MQRMIIKAKLVPGLQLTQDSGKRRYYSEEEAQNVFYQRVSSHGVYATLFGVRVGRFTANYCVITHAVIEK